MIKKPHCYYNDGVSHIWGVRMKQSYGSDKYTVAWFKIAEFVARGEKERALGVYRLLSHSIEDSALIRQLEGDILLSFQDKNCIKKYHEAAQLYYSSHRLQEAAAVYEHICTLEPNESSNHQILVEIYQQMGLTYNVLRHIHVLVKHAVTVRDWHTVTLLVQQLQKPEFKDHIGFFETILMELAGNKDAKNIAEQLLHTILDHYVTHASDESVAQLLNKLQGIDTELWQYACDLIV